MNEGSDNPPPIKAKDGHIVPHGSYTAYNRWKCRCNKCRDENARRAREYRERKAQSEGRTQRVVRKGVPAHGTRSRYTSKKHPCGPPACEKCRAANSEYQAERERLARAGLTLKADWE